VTQTKQEKTTQGLSLQLGLRVEIISLAHKASSDSF